MAASMISSSALAAPARAQGLPSLGRRASSFAVVCGTGKKIKTDKPFGIGGGLTVDVDASGRKVKVRIGILLMISFLYEVRLEYKNFSESLEDTDEFLYVLSSLLV